MSVSDLYVIACFSPRILLDNNIKLLKWHMIFICKRGTQGNNGGTQQGEKKVTLSTKHTNQNKYPISYSTDQDETQMQLRNEQSVSIFHVLPFHTRSYITSKLVSNCCPMVIDAKRKHTANTWFNFQFLAFLLCEESSNICSAHFHHLTCTRQQMNRIMFLSLIENRDDTNDITVS